jgi:hypothetical protein
LLLRGFTSRFSFGVFATVQVLIDVETVANFIGNAPRLHTASHSFVGSLIPATIAIVIHRPAFRLAARLLAPLPSLGRWAFGEVAFARGPLMGSALIGAWSHVVFDSVMHADARPFMPFSAANPFLQIISSSSENWICLVCGVVGMTLLAFRTARKENGPKEGPSSRSDS